MENAENWNLISLAPLLSFDSIDKMLLPNIQYFTDQINSFLSSEEFNVLVEKILNVIKNTYLQENTTKNNNIKNIMEFLPAILPMIKDKRQDIVKEVSDSSIENVKNNTYAQIPNIDKLFINMIDEMVGHIISSLEGKNNLQNTNKKQNKHAVKRILSKK